ncbi:MULTISPECIES: hypothetical protein [unclassified Corallococcus]|uniref:hypothetical protein n=1 Tax=unclassified Corallococcus TaxID=2685029 RepID=UPI001A8F8927|nr:MULTISPECIES: hypothetical protein [unclassified Corallococcus]MBN9685374.1 hypothetical protein [Corallococcus sp. NCSPR001]WAS83175.1 hypothetical protein O0N60_28120 [Corallococcus sp. NCRR]
MATKKKLTLRNPLKAKRGSASPHAAALQHIDTALTLIPSAAAISEAFEGDNPRELSDAFAGAMAAMDDAGKALPANAAAQRKLDEAFQSLPTPRGVLEAFRLYEGQQEELEELDEDEEPNDTTDYPSEMASAASGAVLALESLRGALTDAARLTGLSVCIDCGYCALSPALVSAHGITKKHSVTTVEALRAAVRRPATMPSVPLTAASQLDRASKAVVLASECMETFAAGLGTEKRKNDTARRAYELADALRITARQVTELAARKGADE